MTHKTGKSGLLLLSIGLCHHAQYVMYQLMVYILSIPAVADLEDQEPCVQELMQNTTCGRTDFNCLCNHGLVSNDIGYCFETHCLPSVRDYLSKTYRSWYYLEKSQSTGFPALLTPPTGAQNVTTADCGVVDREQPPFVKIASISLGIVALACITLRLLERSDNQDTLWERCDDRVIMLNGVILTLAFSRHLVPDY